MGTSSITTTGRGFLGGRPRGRLLTTIRPFSISSPPQTPQGSARSIAPLTQSAASEHLLQIALARAMSSGMSEKNRWVRVPWPSAQRGLWGAHGDRLDQFGELVVDVDVDVSVEVDCVHFGWFLSDEWEGVEKAERPPGSDPDGLGADALDVVALRRLLPEASGWALDSGLVHEIEVHVGRHCCTPLVAMDEPVARARA